MRYEIELELNFTHNDLSLNYEHNEFYDSDQVKGLKKMRNIVVGMEMVME